MNLPSCFSNVVEDKIPEVKEELGIEANLSDIIIIRSSPTGTVADARHQAE
jgi:hypothetical protein